MVNILSIINYVLNLIYPNVCGICDKIYKKNLCPKCEIRLNNLAKLKIDYYNNKYFSKHLYIFKYEGIIKNKLIDYKFNQKTYIYKCIIEFITKNKKFCKILKSYDIIIPVPIHYFRKVKRGYNQSELLAKGISKILGLNYKNNVLKKIKNNKPQSTKNKKDRKENVINAYKIKNVNEVTGKSIILLDDIFTTGNTVNECSKVLKQNGAKDVAIITIAKD